ncbi:conserved hypothetical protein [Pyrobaculum neutrophilum V24Sta]|uniref:Uncharacterized protein n=1 Tax=Pyrobaculum neutrophilum (strain DSM 2338 / JCM 9278 / NBRC 100436 / V24Sta) TaxID=444157 RepID=B1YE21_PYRNV|nr:conserved hypothetical protein [Pyrobaculum neutrophilum V24Sta]
MTELKYAQAGDEEVLQMIRQRLREMRQLLAEIREMLKVK